METNTLQDALLELDKISTEGISTQTITLIVKGVASEYARLGQLLDRNNAWRFTKLRDAADDAHYVSGFQSEYGINPTLVSLLELMVFSADLGRLIITAGQNTGKVMPHQVEHGRLSSEFIALYLTDAEKEHVLWHAILEAVERHSYKGNPTREYQDNSPIAFLMTGLLRDLDMYGGWKTGLKYLDPFTISHEMATWKLSDEPYIPEIALEAFRNGQPINRDTVETYSGFLLQFLAWGYNFTFREQWQRVVTSGNPSLVLNRILHKLEAGGQVTQAQEIAQVARTALGVVR